MASSGRDAGRISGRWAGFAAVGACMVPLTQSALPPGPLPEALSPPASRSSASRGVPLWAERTMAAALDESRQRPSYAS